MKEDSVKYIKFYGNGFLKDFYEDVEIIKVRKGIRWDGKFTVYGV